MSRSSEVSPTVRERESFPDFQLPPSQAVEPSAVFIAELAKQKQPVVLEQPLPLVVHQTSPGPEALEGNIASVQPAFPSTDARVREEKPVTIPGPPRAAPSPKLVNTERLVSRAQSLVRQGDISAARLLLEPAVDAGSAQAAFLLAQTYDRGVLASWRVRGIAGDDAKARLLYTRAYQGGLCKLASESML